MNLRLLQHAVTLGRTLSYTKAAQELGMTQSALSRSIQSLEQQARARLFDRDRGGVRVTDLGRDYLHSAASLLREAQELDQMLVRSASAEIGEVRFGMAPVPARALMPNVLSRELNSRPDLRLSTTVGPADSLLRLIRSEEIEFCLCAEQHIRPEDMRVMTLGHFPISVLVRTGHPLLLGTQSEPSRFPLVAASLFQITAQAPEYFVPLFSKQPYLIINDLSVLAQATATSDALWLTSGFAAQPEIQDGLLQELPVPDGSMVGHFRMMMYSRARRSLSPGAIFLRDLFAEEIRRLTRRGANRADFLEGSPGS